jgi:hypothetical protein
MQTMEVEYIDYQSPEYLEYSYMAPQPYFASKMQLFAVIVYLLSHSFGIPLLAIGPSWAVWPRLDDFATIFLFLVYLSTRNNTYPMDRNERTISAIVIIGLVMTIPSILLGTVLHPDLSKGFTFGIFQTYRIGEYLLVWLCIRGMIFSPKQFDKISYAAFFIGLFVVVICIGNITGAIPPAKLTSHLPSGWVAGHFTYLMSRSGPSAAMGPYAGSLTSRMILLTMVLLGSRKPSVVFRIPLIVLIAGAICFGAARAGIIGWAFAVAIFSCKSFKQLAAVMFMILLFFIAASLFSSSVDVDVMQKAKSDIVSIVGAENREEQLSGRPEQWAAIGRYLLSHPQAIIMGVGWGFTANVFQGNAHCMYLHILCEAGIFGLAAYLFLLTKVYRLLQGKDRLLSAVRAAFLAYLLTSFTGEVFYPTSATGSFLGFIAAFFAIAVASYRGRLLEAQYSETYEFSEGGSHYSYTHLEGGF